MGKCHLYHSKRNLGKYRSNEREINTYLRNLVKNQDEIIQAQKEIIVSLKLKEARLLTRKELAKQALVKKSR